MYGAEDKTVQDSVEKTQFIENPRKRHVLLRIIYAQVAINLCIILKWKRVSRYQHVAHNVIFGFFLTPLPFLPQKTSHIFMNVLQKKSRQASQDTFFLMIEFKSLSIFKNEICTIKKKLPLIKLERQRE